MFLMLDFINISGALKDVNNKLVGIWGIKKISPTDIVLISKDQLLLDARLRNSSKSSKTYVEEVFKDKEELTIIVNNEKDLIPQDCKFFNMENAVIFRYPAYTLFKLFSDSTMAKDFTESLNTFIKILYSPEFLDKYQIKNINIDFCSSCNTRSKVVAYVNTWLTNKEAANFRGINGVIDEFLRYFQYKEDSKENFFNCSYIGNNLNFAFVIEFSTGKVVPYTNETMPECTKHVINNFTCTEYIKSGLLYKDCGNITFKPIAWKPVLKGFAFQNYEIENFKKEKNLYLDRGGSFTRYYFDGKEFYDMTLSYNRSINIPDLKVAVAEIASALDVINELYISEFPLWSVKVYDCMQEMFYKDFVLWDKVNIDLEKIQEAVRKNVSEIEKNILYNIDLMFNEDKLRVCISRKIS